MHLFPLLSSCNPFFSKMQRVGPLRMSFFCRRCWGCDYIHLVWRWTWVWTELLLYVSCWIQEREAAWLGVVWYQTLSWRLRWNLNRSTFVWNSLAMFMGAKVRPLERTGTWLIERGIPEMFITCSSWSLLLVCRPWPRTFDGPASSSTSSSLALCCLCNLLFPLDLVSKKLDEEDSSFSEWSSSLLGSWKETVLLRCGWVL